jgi:insulysin
MSSQSDSNLEISANDKRKYRRIKLKNNLEALLVEDPETEKSSACCDVRLSGMNRVIVPTADNIFSCRVGSMYDPTIAMGLAHFLEHMLFMGTRDYPEENAYSAYLNAHGGYSNAYTAQEDTVYYFDVQSDSLEEALTMFASFFTCPLFAESSVDREINAVDSENQKNLQADGWRHYQLFKSLAKKDHPFSRFSTGNLKTLGEAPKSQGFNIRQLMIKFYEDYYSANLMKLVVYGKEPLDTLQVLLTGFLEGLIC